MTPEIVLLPEDRDGRVARRLVTAALQCLVRDLQTHRLAFAEPAPGLARLFQGRAWAQRRFDRTTLVQAVATELGRGRIVVAHYDADCAWPGPSKNDEEFRARVREPIANLTATDRLVAMVPFVSIESWAYRNTDRALACCEESGTDTELHRGFADDPSQLEATLGVKDQSPLGDRFNLVLVGAGWPREAANADRRSFAAFVDRLAAIPSFVASLPVP